MMLTPYQRKLVRIFQGIQFDICIKGWPMKLSWTQSLYVKNLFYRGGLEYRIVGKRDEIFPIVNEQPKSCSSDIRDFTLRNADSRQI